jgi:hypothetical protein
VSGVPESSFAVETIRRWWYAAGQEIYHVAGPGVASFMKPHRRNSATASAAASYRDAAGTWTACMIPWVSVKETRQVRVFGTITA